MTADDDPIAYTALTEGTPVLSAEGSEIGRVERVLFEESIDLFDGIVVSTGDGLRFVDADQVVGITRGSVRCSVAAAEAAGLPVPSGAAVYDLDQKGVRSRNPWQWFKRKVKGSDWEREGSDRKKR